MHYRRFGRTELRMPLFSCGGMRYQQTWDDATLEVVEEENQRNLEATIRRALQLGINHIETARAYGTSERQLGVLFPKLFAEGLPREDLIVQTKVAPHADPGVFRANVEDSLRRLNLDHVDLLGLHGVNTYEQHWQAVRPGGCLEVARELQAEGRARHVGFSTHGSTRQIVDTITSDAHGGFDYVNLHWYYIYQRNWPAIEAAAERDMGVFIISPSDKGGMLYKPPAELTGLCRPLHPLVFNCLFCLRRPEVHTLSLGASCPGDFDLQASSLPMLEQAGGLLPPIERRLEEAMARAVAPDFLRRAWTGLPEWDSAPGYMNLGVVIWLRSLALAFGLTEYGQMRYNLLGNGGHWFPGLSAEAVDQIDPDKLAKCVKDSPFAEHIPAWLREAHDLLGGDGIERLGRG